MLAPLRAHESDLGGLGVAHAADFGSVAGSVARGDTGATSDIDVLVEFVENRPVGIFEYSRIRLYINEPLRGAADVVNRRSDRPMLLGYILEDAVDEALIRHTARHGLDAVKKAAEAEFLRLRTGGEGSETLDDMGSASE